MGHAYFFLMHVLHHVRHFRSHKAKIGYLILVHLLPRQKG